MCNKSDKFIANNHRIPAWNLAYFFNWKSNTITLLQEKPYICPKMQTFSNVFTRIECNVQQLNLCRIKCSGIMGNIYTSFVFCRKALTAFNTIFKVFRNMMQCLLARTFLRPSEKNSERFYQKLGTRNLPLCIPDKMYLFHIALRMPRYQPDAHIMNTLLSVLQIKNAKLKWHFSWPTGFLVGLQGSYRNHFKQALIE